jgi:hypothetical protein
MQKINNDKKKIILLFFGLILTVSSVFWAAVYFFKIKDAAVPDQAMAKNSDLNVNNDLASTGDSLENCGVENNGNGVDDDILSVGCNGFF